jgi:hypothetical protein
MLSIYYMDMKIYNFEIWHKLLGSPYGKGWEKKSGYNMEGVFCIVWRARVWHLLTEIIPMGVNKNARMSTHMNDGKNIKLYGNSFKKYLSLLDVCWDIFNILNLNFFNLKIIQKGSNIHNWQCDYTRLI